MDAQQFANMIRTVNDLGSSLQKAFMVSRRNPVPGQPSIHTSSFEMIAKELNEMNANLKDINQSLSEVVTAINTGT